MGRAMLSKSLIQFSVDGWGCVPSLLFDLRPNYGGANEDSGDLLQKFPWCTAALSAPDPAAGPRRPTPPLQTPGHSWASLGWTLGLDAAVERCTCAMQAALLKILLRWQS